MGKKRKAIATKLDEMDRTMYASFSSAANSLSQLYSQSLNHQKLSFQAGERYGFEKIHHWISRQQEGGSRVTTHDILNYLQNELEIHGEEPPSMPLRVPVQHQHFQPATHFTNSGFPVISASSGLTNPCQVTFSEHFPNNGLPMGNGARHNDASSLQYNPVSSNDTSMDMHADS